MVAYQATWGDTKNQSIPARIIYGNWVTQNTDWDGYLTVGIAIPGMKKHFFSHMQGIVGGPFKGQRDHHLQHYDHLDSNKKNNRADNLELVSVQENNARRSFLRAKKAVLRSPEGIRVDMLGVTRYAKHLKLNADNLHRLTVGKSRAVYGWTLWSFNPTTPLVDEIELDPSDWRAIVVEDKQVLSNRYLVNPFGAMLNIDTGEPLGISETKRVGGKPTYYTVSLKTKSGAYVGVLLHRIVAKTFLKNPQK